METIFVKKTNEIRKLKEEIEKKLNVKIKIKKNIVTYTGKSLDEYVASQVFSAINFGFSVRKALTLRDEEFVFRTIHIKEHTKRNLKDIKGRLIGKHGKTREIISDISDSEILIKESDVGIIADAESAENIVTAIIKIIKGAKQSNIYRYLEKMNRLSKKDNII